MHNIGYLVYSEKTSKEKVMDEIHYIARANGDGYSSRMKWHDELPPFETEAEAKQWIDEHDNGWYDDHAVLFRDYSKVSVKFTKNADKFYSYKYISDEPVHIGDTVIVDTPYQGKKAVEVVGVVRMKESEAEFDYNLAEKKEIEQG